MTRCCSLDGDVLGSKLISSPDSVVYKKRFFQNIVLLIPILSQDIACSSKKNDNILYQYFASYHFHNLHIQAVILGCHGVNKFLFILEPSSETGNSMEK